MDNRNGSTSWKIIKFIIVILLAFAAIVGGAGYYVWNALQPVQADSGEKRTIVIPAKSSPRSVGVILEKNKLIKNARMFTVYTKIKGEGSMLKAGKYQFTVGQPIDEIVQKLSKGEVYKDTITVTIPEGFTVEQIADRLAGKNLVNKQVFLHEADKGTFPYDIVKAIPGDTKMKHRLEGYLFPDTYEFKKGTTEHEYIDRMLGRFQEVWDTSWNAKVKQHGLSVHQAVTLASIVEREVRAEGERAKVAGVYLNRLKQQMPLQADATIQYMFGKQKERVTFADLKKDDPYNTYKVKGCRQDRSPIRARLRLRPLSMPSRTSSFIM